VVSGHKAQPGAEKKHTAPEGEEGVFGLGEAPSTGIGFILLYPTAYGKTFLSGKKAGQWWNFLV
jgi:hypothetical protein